MLYLNLELFPEVLVIENPDELRAGFEPGMDLNLISVEFRLLVITATISSDLLILLGIQYAEVSINNSNNEVL